MNYRYFKPANEILQWNHINLCENIFIHQTFFTTPPAILNVLFKTIDILPKKPENWKKTLFSYFETKVEMILYIFLFTEGVFSSSFFAFPPAPFFSHPFFLFSILPLREGIKDRKEEKKSIQKTSWRDNSFAFPFSFLVKQAIHTLCLALRVWCFVLSFRMISIVQEVFGKVSCRTGFEPMVILLYKRWAPAKTLGVNIFHPCGVVPSWLGSLRWNCNLNTPQRSHVSDPNTIASAHDPLQMHSILVTGNPIDLGDTEEVLNNQENGLAIKLWKSTLSPWKS